MSGLMTGLVLLLVVVAPVGALPVEASTMSVTTLTSDELEIQDNGAKTLFTGNVVLRRQGQTLFADRMIRFGDKGPVEATGRVRGVGIGEQGERIEIAGKKARYEPAQERIFIWGNPRVRIRVTDKQGKSEFESDEAWVDLDTRQAKLIRRVKGRIVPGATP